MARKKAQKANGNESVDATAEHNIGNRSEEIVAGLQRLYAIDCQIAQIVEDEIKELRDEKSDIKTSLRERFSLTNKMIQARYYSYRIEQDAKASNDGVTLDAIRELFGALPIGGQGTFLPALKEDENEAHDAGQAYTEGRRAGLTGKNLDTCPYKLPRQKKLKAEWERGWESGQQQLAGELGKKQPTTADVGSA